MINRIPFLLFFITSLILFQTVETKASDFAMADSMRVRWIDGKKFILHKVEPKQTWNLLAKKYNCSVQDLKDSNTGVTELKIGQIINVPVPSPDTKPGTGTKVTEKTTDNPEPVKSTPASAKNVSKAKTPVYHVVLQGETLYGISKKYNKTVDEVKALNNLPSNAVIKDQKLIVGYENDNTVTPALIPVQAPATSAKTEKAEVKSEKVIPVTTKPLKDDNLSVTTTPTSTVNNFDRATKTVSPIKKSNGGRTLMQVNETGVASWIQDGQLNQDKY